MISKMTIIFKLEVKDFVCFKKSIRYVSRENVKIFPFALQCVVRATDDGFSYLFRSYHDLSKLKLTRIGC